MSCSDCPGSRRVTPPRGTFRVGRRERAALAIVRWAKPIAGSTWYRWIGLRWEGMPWPLRVAAAALSPRFRRQNWPGCGCILVLRRALKLVLRAARLDSDIGVR